jgi:hypothetical protein
VISELAAQEPIDQLALVKATSLKFIYFFRNQLPDQYVPNLIGMIAQYLRSERQVNQSYGAACIEKLLVRKRSDGQGNVITD